MNLSFNYTGEVDPNVVERSYLTTADILEICGSFDSNALWAASIGFLVSIVFFFYLGSFRSGLSDNLRAFFDKAGLVTIALMFAVVIVRLLRAG